MVILNAPADVPDLAAKPGLEMLDDKIQAGYEQLSQDRGAATDRWLDAWSEVVQWSNAADITTIAGFDRSFGWIGWASGTCRTWQPESTSEPRSSVLHTESAPPWPAREILTHFVAKNSERNSSST